MQNTPVGDKICRIPLDLKFYAACPQFAHAVYATYPHNNQYYAGYPSAKKGNQNTVGGGHEYKSNQERSAKLISAVAITVTVRDA
jgi:hypothetical protein